VGVPKVVELYNTVFHEDSLPAHTDVAVMMCNEALDGTLPRNSNLDIERPNFTDLNQLLVQTRSNFVWVLLGVFALMAIRVGSHASRRPSSMPPALSAKSTDGSGRFPAPRRSSAPLTRQVVEDVEACYDEADIVCFGDSITASYHPGGKGFEPYGKTLSSYVMELGCKATLRVNGLCGMTAREMAAKMSHPALPDVTGTVRKGLNVLVDGKPGLVILMAGTNDLGMGMSPQAILSDICTLHRACHARGIRTVTVAPSTVAHGPSTFGRQHLATNLRMWARAAPKVVAFCDMMDLIPHTGPSPLWDVDGLHLSASGSKAFGQVCGKEEGKLRDTCSRPSEVRSA